MNVVVRGNAQLPPVFCMSSYPYFFSKNLWVIITLNNPHSQARSSTLGPSDHSQERFLMSLEFVNFLVLESVEIPQLVPRRMSSYIRMYIKKRIAIQVFLVPILIYSRAPIISF